MKVEFERQIMIERDFVSSRRSFNFYPAHVSEILREGIRPPFVLINGQLVLQGAFPTVENLKNYPRLHWASPRRRSTGTLIAHLQIE